MSLLLSLFLPLFFSELSVHHLCVKAFVHGFSREISLPFLPLLWEQSLQGSAASNYLPEGLVESVPLNHPTYPAHWRSCWFALPEMMGLCQQVKCTQILPTPLNEPALIGLCTSLSDARWELYMAELYNNLYLSRLKLLFWTCREVVLRSVLNIAKTEAMSLWEDNREGCGKTASSWSQFFLVASQHNHVLNTPVSTEHILVDSTPSWREEN